MAGAPDEDIRVVGQGATDPVAVADRDHSDPGVGRGLPPAPVAGAGAGREALDVGDVRAQGQRRPQPLLGGVALEGVEAVDRDAAASHLEVRSALAENGGAVGSVDEYLRVLLLDRGGEVRETIELL